MLKGLVIDIHKEKRKVEEQLNVLTALVNEVKLVKRNPEVEAFQAKVRDLRKTVVTRDDAATAQCESILNYVDEIDRQTSMFNEEERKSKNEKMLSHEKETLKELKATMEDYKLQIKKVKENWVLIQLKQGGNPVEQVTNRLRSVTGLINNVENSLKESVETCF